MMNSVASQSTTMSPTQGQDLGTITYRGQTYRATLIATDKLTKESVNLGTIDYQVINQINSLSHSILNQIDLASPTSITEDGVQTKTHNTSHTAPSLANWDRIVDLLTPDTQPTAVQPKVLLANPSSPSSDSSSTVELSLLPPRASLKTPSVRSHSVEPLPPAKLDPRTFARVERSDAKYVDRVRKLYQQLIAVDFHQDKEEMINFKPNNTVFEELIERYGIQHLEHREVFEWAIESRDRLPTVKKELFTGDMSKDKEYLLYYLAHTVSLIFEANRLAMPKGLSSQMKMPSGIDARHKYFRERLSLKLQGFARD